MKKVNIFFGALAISLLLFTSCDSDLEEVEKATVIGEISANAEDTLVDNGSRYEGEAHSGHFVFRTDSAHQYGATQIFNVNDSLINSSLRVIVDFWAKTNNPLKGDGLAIAFQNNDQEITSWSNFELVNYGAKKNEWTNFIDSITIGADKFTQGGMFFKFFAYNPNQKAQMDMDDIKISIKKITNVME